MGPTFSEFSDFNKKFIDKYEKYLKEYPYAFMLVEKELRNIESGREWLAHSNLGSLSRYKFIKSCYKAYVFFAVGYLLNASLKNYISLPKFLHLEKRLEHHYGVLIGIRKNKLLYIKKLLTGEEVRLSALAVTRRQYCKYFDLVLRDGFFSLTENYLKKVDRLVKKDVAKLAVFLEKLGVERVIVEGDSTASSRVLCEATKMAGAKYLVVAHGYVQDPNLISIAPIYADKIFMWTYNQRLSLQKAVTTESQKSKVLFKGTPLNIKEKSDCEEKKKERFLFALEPLPKVEEENIKFVKIVANYAKKVSSHGGDPVFRLHPKDRKNEEEFLKMVDCGSLSERGDIYSDISSSNCVIVSNSSVAVQSALCGIKSIQIKELKKFDFEYTHEMDLDCFDAFLKSGGAGRCINPHVELLSAEAFQ